MTHSACFWKTRSTGGGLGSVSASHSQKLQNILLLPFPFTKKKKKKVVSVTAQEINDILGSIPAPCSLQPPSRLPGIGAPLLPLPGIESWSHSPSNLFCNFSKLEQSRKKAPVSINIWHSPWSWHLNLTCSGGTPSSARADSKNLFAGFPTTSAWISQAYCEKKERETQKKLIRKGRKN